MNGLARLTRLSSNSFASTAGRCGELLAFNAEVTAASSSFQHACRRGMALAAIPSRAESLTAVTKGLLVDTLDMMRRFEKMGMTRKQAEELTEHIAGVLCVNKEKISESFVSKAALEKSVLEQEARVAGFKSEVVKSQELHLASLMRDTERLTTNLGNLRNEIRYEVEKLTASQRLDLNLEKGRMRDELQSLRDKSNELEIKLDKEINMLKATTEQVKNETVKYCLGLLLAFTTAGLGAARLVSR
ncbi:hypothetical protein WJX73_008162 [Symbiochloris irregularis]|uniref:Mitochondrial protein n=1 Tax=Symbiochloris irregularis TaxID=706552 RepID=A0AAW1PLW4_9CHLO